MTSEFPDTIADAVTRELVVKKSRFIAQVAPVGSAVEAEAIIAAIRKRDWDARHHCVAMVLGASGGRARSSDDGEPSGTAGVPMLEVLRRRELTDVVAVVTRYFGGTKLGAGGLIRAYSTAIAQALDQATPMHRRRLQQLSVQVRHADAGRIEHFLRDWLRGRGGSLGEITYGAAARFEVWMPPPELARFGDDLAAVSAGALTAELGREEVVNVRGPLIGDGR